MIEKDEIINKQIEEIQIEIYRLNEKRFKLEKQLNNGKNCLSCRNYYHNANDDCLCCENYDYWIEDEVFDG